jgi:hypothetical protein
MPGISAMYSMSSARSAISSPAAACPTAGHRSPVGVDVLPEQRHFLTRLRGETGDLGQDVVEGA